MKPFTARSAAAAACAVMAVADPAVGQRAVDDRVARVGALVRTLNGGQPQPALEGLRRDFPFLAEAVAGYALGEVWARPGLDHRTRQIEERTKAMAANPYVGMWVTEDGNVRHELLPNGRYVEARGTREKAYQGRYMIIGDHIDYVDDTGFTADGDFVDGVLHHGGMILHRRK